MRSKEKAHYEYIMGTVYYWQYCVYAQCSSAWLPDKNI